MNHWVVDVGCHNLDQILQLEIEEIMHRRDIISGLFFLIVGVFFIINAGCLDLGTFSDPGPGLIPLIPGILLSVLSAVLVFKSYKSMKFQRQTGGRAAGPAGSLKWPPVVIITLSTMLVFALVLESLGFVVSSFLMMLFLFKFIGNNTWIRSVLGAVLSVGSCYLIFEVWLSVQFPMGPWGF
jgi:putative tricarboxylic transport membrane protein